MKAPGVVALVVLALVASATCGDSPPAPTVTVGDAKFAVEVLATPGERTRGLSGRETLEPGAGAIFVYGSGKASALWMKGMLFDLDFVWIGEDCTVVDVTKNVPRPEPGKPDASLPRYRSSAPATYSLEINAGEAESAEIRAGATVRFSEFSVTGNGC
jgi:hypothetical protein